MEKAPGCVPPIASLEGRLWFEALTVYADVHDPGGPGRAEGRREMGWGKAWASPKALFVAALSSWQRQRPPENPQCRPPSMPTQPRAKAPGAPRRCSSLLCVCGPAGREGRGWEGGQDGCRQHLQHLLICITADTLLDQENGDRNNKGGGDSLRGPLRFSFLASKLPVLRARGQPHSQPLVREMHLLLLQTPHPGLPLPLAPDPPALPLSFLGAYSTHPSFLWEPSPWSPSHTFADPSSAQLGSCSLRTLLPPPSD